MTFEKYNFISEQATLYAIKLIKLFHVNLIEIYLTFLQSFNNFLLCYKTCLNKVKFNLFSFKIKLLLGWLVAHVFL